MKAILFALALVLLLSFSVAGQTIKLTSTRTMTAVQVSEMSFDFEGGPGRPRDYVSLHAMDGSGFWQWKYLDNTTVRNPARSLRSGTVSFGDIKPGKYELRFYVDGTITTLPPLKVLPFELFTTFDAIFTADDPIAVTRKPGASTDSIEMIHANGSKELFTVARGAAVRKVEVTVKSATVVP